MKRIKSLLCSLLIVFMMSGLLVSIAPSVVSEAKSSVKTEDLTVSLKGGSIEEGSTKQLTLKVKKPGESKWIKGKKLTEEFGKVTWSSSDKSIATVTSKGKVKGIKKGTVTITAKTKSGLKASCKIKVKEIDKSGLHKISLSGNKEDHVITDRLCYIEEDKFFLLLDKDLDLPGDLCKNISLIIDTLEEKVGYTFDGCETVLNCDCGTVHFGYNPWEGLSFGKKIPIYIYVDREDTGYISNAAGEFAILYLYELFSLDFWNSVPTYRDNMWRRRNCIDYFTIAHELTHVLTLRYASLSRSMTEGSANYFGMETVKALAHDNNEFQQSLDSTYIDMEVGVEVTPDNAEQIFLDDFKNVDFADRGAEYAFGMYICTYLADAYGASFMHDYLQAVSDSGFNANYGYYTDKDMKKLTDIFKKVFGKKVFEKFGKWYSKNVS